MCTYEFKIESGIYYEITEFIDIFSVATKSYSKLVFYVSYKLFKNNKVQISHAIESIKKEKV